MKKGYIEIVSGMFQGHKYGFIHGVTMGRGKGNSLRLIDTKASRVHAEIVSTKEGFVIKDLKSTNGTFVNGEQVKTRLLRSGDRIRLGSTELLFSERDIFAGEDTRTRVKINTERGQVGACGPKSAGGKALLSEIGLQELKDRFQAILRVNRTLGSVVDLQRAFEKLLEEIFSILPADRGAILSVNEETGKLEILCSRTRRGPVDVGDILVSHTILNKVMEESVGLLVEDAASDERFELSESISAEDIRSAMCAPLIQNNETLGIIYLDVQGLQRAFSQQDLDLLMAIAAPASVQVQNALYMERLRHSYWDTISVLSNAI